MGSLTRDLAFSIRLLFKRPWFTAAAVAVLSLGIGANTAIFSLINNFLLKPLVLQKPEQLVGCFSRDTHKPDSYRGFSYPNYADLRQNRTVFSAVAAHNLAMVGLAEGDTTRRAFVDIVSSNYFQTLGVPLYRGRAFTPAEERPGSGATVAIASHAFWKRSGATTDGFLGKTLRVNGHLFTVVGIAAEGFTGTTRHVQCGAVFSPGSVRGSDQRFRQPGPPPGGARQSLPDRHRTSAARLEPSDGRQPTGGGSRLLGTGIPGGKPRPDVRRAASLPPGRQRQPPKATMG